jgi:hypothetical protein
MKNSQYFSPSSTYYPISADLDRDIGIEGYQEALNSFLARLWAERSSPRIRAELRSASDTPNEPLT